MLALPSPEDLLPLLLIKLFVLILCLCFSGSGD